MSAGESEYRFYNLKRDILALSEEPISFYRARIEWNVIDAEECEVPVDCLCGKRDITTRYIIENEANGNITYVGNTCVKKFTLQVNEDDLETAFNKIQMNRDTIPNYKVINYAYNNGILRPGEYDFLEQMLFGDHLTDKRRAWIVDINDRIMENIYNRDCYSENSENSDVDDNETWY